MTIRSTKDKATERREEKKRTRVVVHGTNAAPPFFLSFLFLMVLSRIPAEWYCDAFLI
jgi:hypothetical protein